MSYDSSSDSEYETRKEKRRRRKKRKLLNLTSEDKMLYYAGVGIATYYIYNTFGLFDIYNRINNTLDKFNSSYVNKFPKLPQILKSVDSKLDWTSDNLSLGGERILEPGTRDTFDNKGYFQVRGNAKVRINGEGSFFFANDGSDQTHRLYFNTNLDGDHDNEPLNYAHKYTNVEITAYRKRYDANPSPAYSGFVIGCRSGANGHASDNNGGGSNYGSTHTYYAKFRNDNVGINDYNYSFSKELEHPYNNEIVSHSDFGGNPFKKFIGMKFICFTYPGTTRVHLELWTDEVSNADPLLITKKSNWRKLYEIDDDFGYWTAQVSGNFPTLNPDAPCLDGGIVFIRDQDTGLCEYKFIEIREIIPAELPLFEVPSVVRNLNYVNLTANSLRLQWTEPEFTNIKNQTNTEPIVEYYISSIGPDRYTPFTSIDIGDLTDGRQYTFTVQSRTARTTRERWSDPQSILVTSELPNNPAIAPTNVNSPHAIIYDNNTGFVSQNYNLKLTWVAPTFPTKDPARLSEAVVTGYKITGHVTSNTSGSAVGFPLQDVILGNILEYTYVSAPLGATYDFKLYATNNISSGYSDPTNYQFIADFLSPPPSGQIPYNENIAPSPPTLVEGKGDPLPSPLTASILITWSPPDFTSIEPLLASQAIITNYYINFANLSLQEIVLPASQLSYSTTITVPTSTFTVIYTLQAKNNITTAPSAGQDYTFDLNLPYS